MSTFTPLPPAQQPAWLAQLHQVVRAYSAGAFFVLECRWCSEGWTLPRDYAPATHVGAVLEISIHGMQHAGAGELVLDDDGEPVDEQGSRW